MNRSAGLLNSVYIAAAALSQAIAQDHIQSEQIELRHFARAAAIRQEVANPADTSAPHIETFTLESKVFGNSRTIRVYLPRSYYQTDHKDQNYPIIYLNDGFAVFKPALWNAPEIVAQLVNENRIPEIILVGIDNGATASGGSPDQRTNEYVPYPDTTNEPSVPNPQGFRYPSFLFNEVLPAVTQRYRVKKGEEFTAIGGSSYGGLAALYAVIHNPGIFGGLILESTPTFMAEFKILKEAELLHSWPLRVFIGIGTNESQDEQLNRSAIPRCQQLRDQIRAESPSTEVKLFIGQGDSHNAKAWSRRLPYALEFLFVPSAKEE